MGNINYYKTIYSALRSDKNVTDEDHPLTVLVGRIKELGGDFDGLQHDYTKIRYLVYSVQHYLGIEVDVTRPISKYIYELRFEAPKFNLRGARRDGPIMVAWFYYFHETEARKWHESIERLLPDEHKKFIRPKLKVVWNNKKDFERYFKAGVPSKEPHQFESHLELELPSKDSAFAETSLRMKYSQRATDFIGRKNEFEQLRSFLEPDATRNFLWWQIAGPAGQGKSRLALELLYQASNENWHCGFVREFNESYLEKISQSKFEQDTLIVIDYAADPERSLLLGKAIKELERVSVNSNTNHRRVRLLVLERQPYDGLFSLDFGTHPEEWANSWQHVLLKERRIGAAFRTVYQPERALTLSYLHDEELKDIARSWASSEGVDFTLAETEIVNQFLGIDQLETDEQERENKNRSRRPLIAIMAADAAIRGVSLDSYDDREPIEILLSDALDNDARQMFGAPKNGQDIEGFGVMVGTQNQKNLSALANIIREAKILDAINASEVFSDITYDDIKAVFKLLGYSVRVIPEKFNTKFHSREPDLLGEYQVIRYVKELCGFSLVRPNKAGGKELLTEIIQVAWELNRSETASFLIRMMQDFADNWALEFLVFVKPYGEASLIQWANILTQYSMVAPYKTGAKIYEELLALGRTNENLSTLAQIFVVKNSFVIQNANLRKFEEAVRHFEELEEEVGENRTASLNFYLANSAYRLCIELGQDGKLIKAIQYQRKAKALSEEFGLPDELKHHEQAFARQKIYAEWAIAGAYVEADEPEVALSKFRAVEKDAIEKKVYGINVAKSECLSKIVLGFILQQQFEVAKELLPELEGIEIKASDGAKHLVLIPIYASLTEGMLNENNLGEALKFFNEAAAQMQFLEGTQFLEDENKLTRSAKICFFRAAFSLATAFMLLEDPNSSLKYYGIGSEIAGDMSDDEFYTFQANALAFLVQAALSVEDIASVQGYYSLLSDMRLYTACEEVHLIALGVRQMLQNLKDQYL